MLPCMSKQSSLVQRTATMLSCVMHVGQLDHECRVIVTGNELIACLPLQVAGLFRRHDDLLQEFTYFLPDSTAPAAQHVRRLPPVGEDDPQIFDFMYHFKL